LFRFAWRTQRQPATGIKEPPHELAQALERNFGGITPTARHRDYQRACREPTPDTFQHPLRVPGAGVLRSKAIARDVASRRLRCRRSGAPAPKTIIPLNYRPE